MTFSVKTVLLVESDILVRAPLAKYLRECGYRVLEARSTIEVEAHLSHPDRSIHLVLADVNAVDEGGFVFAARVRREHPGVSVILGGTPDKTVEKAADLCDEGPPISKPYDHQIVLERIRRMIAARDRYEGTPNA